MTATTDLQTAAAHYDALATALKARLSTMTADFDRLSFEAQESIDGLVMAAAANGVQVALHAAQSQLFQVLADLAPERDL